MARHRPRAPKLVVSIEKVCECWLHLQKERSKLVDRGKWLKETQLRVDLVSNSSYLNREVGITGLVILNFGKQILVSHLLYLPVYSLILLCFRSISCDVFHCLLGIVYIYLSVSLEVHCIYSVN
jgi:hypothetical protein